MAYHNAEGDAAAERLERRWFAAFKAASAARAECEALLDEMDRFEMVWNEARIRLAELEALRDVLGEELAGLEHADNTASAGAQLDVMTAA